MSEFGCGWEPAIRIDKTSSPLSRSLFRSLNGFQCVSFPTGSRRLRGRVRNRVTPPIVLSSSWDPFYHPWDFRRQGGVFRILSPF